MQILGIIPARYASTRFPAKALVDIGGKSMIQRVFEQSSKATHLSQIIVATDDERILDHVHQFGGKAVMTSENHQSGTDRCFEALQKTGGNYDYVINIQGDEPFIDPKQINLIGDCFEDENVQLATLIKEIHSEEELFNPNVPKVVIGSQQQALYFSRHPIPYLRNPTHNHQYYKHIGIYGYKTATLLEITQLNPSTLELAESLEQLRWIENGYQIQTKLTDIETIAIDSPNDLLKINF